MRYRLEFVLIAFSASCCAALSGCHQGSAQSGTVDFGYTGVIGKRATYVLQYGGMEEARIVVVARGQRPLPTLDTRVIDTAYTTWTLTWRLENTGRRLTFESKPAHYPNGPNGLTEKWLTVYS